MSTFAAALILAVVLAAASLDGQLASLQPVDLFKRQNLEGWVNVNTAEDTWTMRDGVLICSGRPIGVMRSAGQYENFVLHIEWMHMEAGGNSGVFVWSNARPAER